MINYEDALKVVETSAARVGFDVARLAGPIRNVYLIGQLEFELATGGVAGWLTNRSGRFADETVEALERVKAHKCAAIVRQILVTLAGALPSEEDERARRIKSLSGTAHGEWRKLTDALLEWPDDIDQLLRDYVELHTPDFIRAAMAVGHTFS